MPLGVYIKSPPSYGAGGGHGPPLAFVPLPPPFSRFLSSSGSDVGRRVETGDCGDKVSSHSGINCGGGREPADGVSRGVLGRARTHLVITIMRALTQVSQPDLAVKGPHKTTSRAVPSNHESQQAQGTGRECCTPPN